MDVCRRQPRGGTGSSGLTQLKRGSSGNLLLLVARANPEPRGPLSAGHAGQMENQVAQWLGLVRFVAWEPANRDARA